MSYHNIVKPYNNTVYEAITQYLKYNYSGNTLAVNHEGKSQVVGKEARYHCIPGCHKFLFEGVLLGDSMTLCLYYATRDL
jgi:hypothetical protein